MNGKPSRQSDDRDVMSECSPTAVPNAATLTNRYEYSGAHATRDEGVGRTEVSVGAPEAAPDIGARQNADIWGS